MNINLTEDQRLFLLEVIEFYDSEQWHTAETAALTAELCVLLRPTSEATE